MIPYRLWIDTQHSLKNRMSYVPQKFQFAGGGFVFIESIAIIYVIGSKFLDILETTNTEVEISFGRILDFTYRSQKLISNFMKQGICRFQKIRAENRFISSFRNSDV